MTMTTISDGGQALVSESPFSHPLFIAQLLAALSHELGSPLAAIKGAATTLIDYRQRLPDDRIEGFLQSIDAQTDRLSDLLDDVVLMARLQLGTVQIQPAPIALSAVLDQALDELPAEQRGWVTCERSDALILAEAKYLERAFVYLFKHILQHTPASSAVTLHIRIVDQQRVVIGIDGVDADLADPLARLEDLSASVDAGRGRPTVTLLRLALSRTLIELHAGRWWLDEKSEQGNALCVSLPLARPDELSESD
jgi:two-component system, OmpR family, sensor histidine kinase KdpD